MNHFLGGYLLFGTAYAAWEAWTKERKSVEPSAATLLVTIPFLLLNVIAACRLWGAP